MADTHTDGRTDGQTRARRGIGQFRNNKRFALTRGRARLEAGLASPPAREKVPLEQVFGAGPQGLCPCTPLLPEGLLSIGQLDPAKAQGTVYLQIA